MGINKVILRTSLCTDQKYLILSFLFAAYFLVHVSVHPFLSLAAFTFNLSALIFAPRYDEEADQILHYERVSLIDLEKIEMGPYTW